jgi:hypothetical protein
MSDPLLRQSGDRVELRVIAGEAEEDAPVKVRRRERFCRHHRFQLDATARRVYCGDCEGEIDAFDALKILADMFERVNGRYKHASAEAKRVEARLQELKRQERNAKARVRRAS